MYGGSSESSSGSTQHRCLCHTCKSCSLLLSATRLRSLASLSLPHIKVLQSPSLCHISMFCSLLLSAIYIYVLQSPSLCHISMFCSLFLSAIYLCFAICFSLPYIYALRIVSTDKNLRFTNTLIIIISSAISFYLPYIYTDLKYIYI